MLQFAHSVAFILYINQHVIDYRLATATTDWRLRSGGSDCAIASRRPHEAGSLFEGAERAVAACAESAARNRALARWRTHCIAKRRANLRRSFARNCSLNAALRAARRSKNSLLRAREPTREFAASPMKKRAREHLALDQRCCFSPKNFLLLCLICAMLLKNFLRKVESRSRTGIRAEKKVFESLGVPERREIHRRAATDG